MTEQEQEPVLIPIGTKVRCTQHWAHVPDVQVDGVVKEQRGRYVGVLGHHFTDIPGKEYVHWYPAGDVQVLPEQQPEMTAEKPAETDLGQVAYEGYWSGKVPAAWDADVVYQARWQAAAAAVKLEVLLQTPACIHDWVFVSRHGSDGSVWGCTRCDQLQIRRLPGGEMW